MKTRVVAFLVLLCCFLIAPPPGRAEVAVLASRGVSSPASGQDVPTALPLACSGAPAPASCVYGYVYYDGEPVDGAAVHIESPHGQLDTATSGGTASAEPYFYASLSDLPASQGETITVTASYNGREAGKITTVYAGGQQVDIAILTNPVAIFGDGSAGDLLVNGAYFLDDDYAVSGVSGLASTGSTSLPVDSAAGFAVGDAILIHQSRGAGAGAWEFALVAGTGASLTLLEPLQHTYIDGGLSSPDQAQVVEVPQFANCTVNPGGVLGVHGWDGNTGGILALFCRETATIDGVIANKSGGYRGGGGQTYTCNAQTARGESASGVGGTGRSPNGSGGGGGDNETSQGANDFGGGGGGGHALEGGDGYGGVIQAGEGGLVSGDTPELSSMLFGGGGGQGGGSCLAQTNGVSGINGGGVILVASPVLTVTGYITTKPDNGTVSENGGGGGGGGGAIFLRAVAAVLGDDRVIALGGLGHPGWNSLRQGGQGGAGRIRVEYSLLDGSTDPATSAQQVDFHTAPMPTFHLLYPQTAVQGKDTVTFIGSAVDNDEAGGSISLYAWRSSLDGELGAQPAFSLPASGLSAGTHTIYMKARDDEGEWSEEISRTLVVRPQYTFLPLGVRDYLAYFEGFWEVEPNNTYLEANGPLRSNEYYFGYPNDARDYFSVLLRQDGHISIDLTNHTGDGVQLQLFYQDTGHLVDYDLDPPYAIQYSGPAGWYYIYIFTEGGWNSSAAYTLVVIYP